jgi:CHAD domain-containing protein
VNEGIAERTARGRVGAATRRALQSLAARDDGPHSRRARAVLAHLSGRDLTDAAAAAGLRETQARHWIRAFERSGLAIFPPAAGAEAAPPVAPAPRRARAPRLRATDATAEALRRLLAFQTARMKKLERGAFEADEDAVHDMRVAIRRVRALLRIARPFFPRKVLAALGDRARETAQALGAVRDVDVLLLHAAAYLGATPDAAAGLEGWMAQLQSRRTAAHEQLRTHLAGKRFRRLGAALRSFLAHEAAPGPDDLRLRDVLGAELWDQYGQVRRYEARDRSAPEVLHPLRIEIKRWRYLMEFFQGVLGKRAEPAIQLAVRAQDHLGRLHDAWVAVGLLRGYIAEHVPLDAGALAAMTGYLTALQQEIESLTAGFDELWQEIAGKALRRRLALLIARL